MTKSVNLIKVKCKICQIILAEYNPKYQWIGIEDAIRNHMVSHVEIIRETETEKCN